MKFEEIWEKCKNKTMLSKERFKVIYDEIKKIEDCECSMAEIGVFRGGVSKMMCLCNPNISVHLFDTFQGMPKKHNKNDIMETGEIKCGEFKDILLSDVKFYFKECDNAIFHIGIFPETSIGLENEIFSLCHIDCDLYFSCLESMKFFYPRLCNGGVIIIDDYDRPECPGVKKAIVEYCKENNLYIDVLEDFQAIVRKK